MPLKYLSNFWRTIGMHLIHCNINLILPWSSTCVIVEVNRETSLATITNTKLYVLVVTLSTNNVKLLDQ